MEITQKLILTFSAGLVAFGIAAQTQTKQIAPQRTAEFVQNSLPLSFGPYKFQENPALGLVSYKMADSTIDGLKAYDITCRIFNEGDKQYDAVVIFGNDRNCFHDPNLCLVGQKWVVDKREFVTVPTKTKGNVPFQILYMTGAQGPRIVAFNYKGSGGFFATQNGLYWDWFLAEMKQGVKLEGAFYRFMTLTGSETKEDLLKFTAAYLDEATKTSKGLL